MTRQCKKCNQVKDITLFRKHKECLFGYTYECKTCLNARKQKESNKPARKQKKSETAWERHIRVNYNMTTNDWENMFNKQNGCCAVCSKALKKDRSTHIDHDHITGVVRSLLHSKCNFAVGLINEDFDIALGLAKYIQEHKAVA